jgi:hypothetical protein
MNRVINILLTIIIISGCSNSENNEGRIPVASVGKVILYHDELPKLLFQGIDKSDSLANVQSYCNRWAKRQLVLQKAEENLSVVSKNEIARQIEETRSNLIIYQYQRQMMLEKMDTVLSDIELENYYARNGNSFILNSNIVKALFVKLPVETPGLETIKRLSRSNDQKDLQQLESLCYQFAEKFDDFNEEWILMNRLSAELPQNIENEDNFLRRTTYYESSDSLFIYLVSIRDYRLRTTLAPFEYVRDDIKRILINSRRFEFIQSLENAIYNEALKENRFKIY